MPRAFPPQPSRPIPTLLIASSPEQKNLPGKDGCQPQEKAVAVTCSCQLVSSRQKQTMVPSPPLTSRCKLQTSPKKHYVTLAKSSPTVGRSPKHKQPRATSVERPALKDPQTKSPTKPERVKPEGTALKTTDQLSEKRSCPESGSNKTSEGHQSKKILMEAQRCLEQLKKQHGSPVRPHPSKNRHSLQGGRHRRGVPTTRTTTHKSESKLVETCKKSPSKPTQSQEFKDAASPTEPRKKVKPPQYHKHQHSKAKKYLKNSKTKQQTDAEVCNVM